MTVSSGDATSSCPVCGGDGLEIIYGFPTQELFEAAQRGEVALGGCIVGGEMPTTECRSCNHTWVVY